MARRLLAAVLKIQPAAERTAREQVRAAIQALRAAEAELQAKTQAIQRLRQVIQDADTAERTADAAERAAKAGAEAWAHAGANDADTEHRSLIDQAVESRRLAGVARIRATGAQQALPSAEAAEEYAKSACSNAAHGIRLAIGALLGALVEPAFARLEQARSAYLESFNHIRGALDTADLPGWGEASRRNLVDGLASIGEKLSALGMPRYTTRGEHSDLPNFNPDQWRDFAKRLATDPDAVPTDVDEG
jgi:hypothetical protein